MNVILSAAFVTEVSIQLLYTIELSIAIETDKSHKFIYFAFTEFEKAYIFKWKTLLELKP